MHFWPIPNFLWLGEYKSFFKIQIFPLLSSQMSRIICHKSLRPNNSGIYLKVEVWYQIIYVLVKQIYKHGVFPCSCGSIWGKRFSFIVLWWNWFQADSRHTPILQKAQNWLPYQGWRSESLPEFSRYTKLMDLYWKKLSSTTVALNFDP